MRFYKKINIDNCELIKSKFLVLLNKNNLLKSNIHGYFLLQHNDILNYCSEIFKSLEILNVRAKSFAVYRTTKHTKAPIHIDAVNYKSRINIPLINCEYSSTVFFKADIKQKQKQSYDNNQYIECVNAVEVDRVTIDQPTVLRIDQPHQVVMDGSKYLRICLTIACDPDPIFLIHKNN